VQRDARGWLTSGFVCLSHSRLTLSQMSAPGLAEALAAINACQELSPAEQAQITAKVIADPRVTEGVGRTPAANIAATVKAILAAGGSVSSGQ
jgi:hypothetical protein